MVLRMQSQTSPLGGGRHLLTWRLLQLPWDLNIWSFRDQTMFLLVQWLSRLSSFLDNPPAFHYWRQGGPERSIQKLFDRWMEYVVIAWAREHLFNSRWYDFASICTVILWSGNTRFHEPSQIAVEACTNPLYKRNPNFVTRVQQYLQTPVWSLMRSQESYPAASCVHSRDPKTFCHPWIAHRSERTMFEHVFHARCCYPPPPGPPLLPMLMKAWFSFTFFTTQEDFKKAEFPHSKSNHYDDFCQLSDLIETFIFLTMDSLLTLGRKWIVARRCAPRCV